MVDLDKYVYRSMEDHYACHNYPDTHIGFVHSIENISSKEHQALLNIM